MSENYRETVYKNDILKLREKLKELPFFLNDFFMAKSEITSTKTRLGYAVDFRIFFIYLIENIPEFKYENISEFTIEDLIRVKPEHIQMFSSYLSLYTKKVDKKDIDIINGASGKSRKLSAIKSMFKYYFKMKKIPANTAELVDLPRVHQKAIVKLEVDEVAKLLDNVESGDHLVDKYKLMHEHTKVRDLALITLLLGTGLRVSECIGIDLTDIDFESNALVVTRKGGDQQVIYFGEEVRTALDDYILQRSKVEIKEGHENALFLSLHKKRICVRQVQTMVKRYAESVTMLKKISPHKLRSTFGTNLYKESSDIFLVADILGHSDVNTTKKHYAAMDEDKRRQAVKYITLRE